MHHDSESTGIYSMTLMAKTSWHQQKAYTLWHWWHMCDMTQAECTCILTLMAHVWHDTSRMHMHLDTDGTCDMTLVECTCIMTPMAHVWHDTSRMHMHLDTDGTCVTWHKQNAHASWHWWHVWHDTGRMHMHHDTEGTCVTWHWQNAHASCCWWQMCVMTLAFRKHMDCDSDSFNLANVTLWMSHIPFSCNIHVYAFNFSTFQFSQIKKSLQSRYSLKIKISRLCAMTFAAHPVCVILLLFFVLSPLL